MSTRIAGDSAAIRALAKEIDGFCDRIHTVCTKLDRVADQLVQDAGWHGKSAEEFEGRWKYDAAAAGALKQATSIFSRSLQNLATGLEQAQSMLEAAVNQADRDGLKLDSEGNVLSQVVPAGQEADFKAAEQNYLAIVAKAQEHARHARQDAGKSTSIFLSALAVGEAPEKMEGLEKSDYAAMAGLLRDYIFAGTPMEENLKTRLDSTARDVQNLQSKLNSMQDPNSSAMDNFNELLKKEGHLSSIESALGKVALWNRALDAYDEKIPLKSAMDGGVLSGGAEELDGKSGFTKFLEDTPGLDVALAGYATWDMASRDHDRGWSWTHAILADGAANLTGVVVGTAASRIPYVGPIAGPVLGYGAAGAVSEWTHNVAWGQNIHDHGVVEGAVDSVGEGLKDTWDNDIVGVGKKLWESF